MKFLIVILKSRITIATDRAEAEMRAGILRRHGSSMQRWAHKEKTCCSMGARFVSEHALRFWSRVIDNLHGIFDLARSVQIWHAA